MLTPHSLPMNRFQPLQGADLAIPTYYLSRPPRGKKLRKRDAYRRLVLLALSLPVLLLAGEWVERHATPTDAEARMEEATGYLSAFQYTDYMPR